MAEPRPSLPTGTVTFLFTDIEGSTRLLQRFGDDYPEMLETHAGLVRQAIDAAGGVEVSTEGDAFFIVFRSAADAAQFAAGAQQGLSEHAWPEGGEIRVRMGMHTGPARMGGDNYVGLDVHRAARVAGVAHGGQVVLTADALQTMSPPPEVLDLGEHHLKDLVAPEHIYQLVVPGTRTQFPPLRVAPQVPEALRTLPAPLDPVDPVFVGRSAEVTVARGWWRRAQSGAPTVGWIVGSPGIGKTRLAAELASDLFRGGVPALYGSALPRTSTALAPLSRALAALGLDAAEFAATTGSAAAGGRDLGVAAGRALPSQGALIVLDDLDLAHSDLVAMTTGLCEGLGNLPVLIVIIAPEPPAGAGAEQVIRLGPLGHEDAVRIAALYAGEDQAEIAAADIAARASGVPAALHTESAAWMRERSRTLLEREATTAAQRRDDLDTARGQLAGAISGLQDLADRVGAHTRDPESESQCPYMGLSAFDESDARFFFGREDLVRELLVRFNDSPVLGVTGPSGSGKSSLVRAGLLPALRDGLLPGGERWRVEIMIPEEHPLAQLGDIMNSPASTEHAVLFVDQFERVFTECPDSDERIAFLGRLAEAAAADSWRVVVSIRSDYFGEPAVAPEFSRLLGEGTILAGPMRLEDLQRAIELPARRVGLTFEPGLAVSIAADVADRPGALPLMSAALVELWEKRRGRTLPAIAYYQGGGVHGAVARLAEDAFGRLDEASQAVARRMLLRMAGPGSADAVVARRVPLSEIRSEGATGRAVLDLLVERRLVTVDGEAFEVAHEALLRDWPRLREWLDGDRQGRELHAHLIAASQQWERGGRQRSDLYRGARLAAAVDWAEAESDEINDLERQFLDAAHLQSQEEAESERRTNRRLRRFLVGLAASLVAAGIAGGLALAARARAQDRAVEADGARLGAEALAVEALDASLLLAVQAQHLDDSAATQGALLAAILKSPQAVAVMRHDAFRLWDSAVSPDGSLFATASGGGSIALWDVATHELIGELEPTDSPVYWVEFSPDGSTLLAFDRGEGPPSRPGYEPGSPRITAWDVATMTMIGSQDLASEPWSQAIDPATGELVTIELGLIHRIDPNTLELVSTTSMPLEGDPVSLAFDRDGSVLAIVSFTGDLLVYEDGGERLIESPTPLTCSGGEPCISAMTTNGRLVAIADETNLEIRVMDLDTLALVATLAGHSGAIRDLLFVGPLLLSGSDDRTVAVWNVTEGRRLEVFSGHAGRVSRLAATSDGTYAFSSGIDSTAMMWDLTGGSRFGSSVGTLGGFGRPPMMTDRELVVVGDFDGFVTLLNVTTGEQERIQLGVGPLWHAVVAMDRSVGATVGPDSSDVFLFDPDPGSSQQVRRFPLAEASPFVALSPDGTELAAVQTGRIEVWDLETTAMLASLPHDLGVATFSRDGRLLAVGGGGGMVTVVDTATWSIVSEFGSADYIQVLGLDFSPDGTSLATATVDGMVRVFDVARGKQVGPDLASHGSFVLSVQFNNDGSRLVSGGGDGTVAVWDLNSMRRVGSPLAGPPAVWVWAWFLEDDNQIVAVFEDGSTRLWDISAAALESHACRVANRQLTVSEWNQYLPGREYSPACSVAA